MGSALARLTGGDDDKRDENSYMEKRKVNINDAPKVKVPEGNQGKIKKVDFYPENFLEHAVYQKLLQSASMYGVDEDKIKELFLRLCNPWDVSYATVVIRKFLSETHPRFRYLLRRIILKNVNGVARLLFEDAVMMILQLCGADYGTLIMTTLESLRDFKTLDVTNVRAVLRYINGDEHMENILRYVAAHLHAPDAPFHHFSAFVQLCVRYPALVFPIIVMQRSLQRRFFGMRFWRSYHTRVGTMLFSNDFSKADSVMVMCRVLMLETVSLNATPFQFGTPQTAREPPEKLLEEVKRRAEAKKERKRIQMEAEREQAAKLAAEAAELKAAEELQFALEKEDLKRVQRRIEMEREESFWDGGAGKEKRELALKKEDEDKKKRFKKMIKTYGEKRATTMMLEEARKEAWLWMWRKVRRGFLGSLALAKFSYTMRSKEKEKLRKARWRKLYAIFLHSWAAARFKAQLLEKNGGTVGQLAKVLLSDEDQARNREASVAANKLNVVTNDAIDFLPRVVSKSTVAEQLAFAMKEAAEKAKAASIRRKARWRKLYLVFIQSWAVARFKASLDAKRIKMEAAARSEALRLDTPLVTDYDKARRLESVKAASKLSSALKAGRVDDLAKEILDDTSIAKVERDQGLATKEDVAGQLAKSLKEAAAAASASVSGNSNQIHQDLKPNVKKKKKIDDGVIRFSRFLSRLAHDARELYKDEIEAKKKAVRWANDVKFEAEKSSEGENQSNVHNELVPYLPEGNDVPSLSASTTTALVEYVPPSSTDLVPFAEKEQGGSTSIVQSVPDLTGAASGSKTIVKSTIGFTPSSTQVTRTAFDTKMRLIAFTFGSGYSDKRSYNGGKDLFNSDKTLPMPVPVRVPDFLLSNVHPAGVVCKYSSLQIVKVVLANFASGAGSVYGLARVPCLLCGRTIRHVDDLLDEIDDVDDDSVAPDEEEVDSVDNEERQDDDDDFDSLVDPHEENEEVVEDDNSSWKEEDEMNLPPDERIEGRRVDETGSSKFRLIPPKKEKLCAVEAEPEAEPEAAVDEEVEVIEPENVVEVSAIDNDNDNGHRSRTISVSSESGLTIVSTTSSGRPVYRGRKNRSHSVDSLVSRGSKTLLAEASDLVQTDSGGDDVKDSGVVSPPISAEEKRLMRIRAGAKRSRLLARGKYTEALAESRGGDAAKERLDIAARRNMEINKRVQLVKQELAFAQERAVEIRLDMEKKAKAKEAAILERMNSLRGGAGNPDISALSTDLKPKSFHEEAKLELLKVEEHDLALSLAVQVVNAKSLTDPNCIVLATGSTPGTVAGFPRSFATAERKAKFEAEEKERQKLIEKDMEREKIKIAKSLEKLRREKELAHQRAIDMAYRGAKENWNALDDDEKLQKKREYIEKRQVFAKSTAKNTGFCGECDVYCKRQMAHMFGYKVAQMCLDAAVVKPNFDDDILRHSRAARLQGQPLVSAPIPSDYEWRQEQKANDLNEKLLKARKDGDSDDLTIAEVEEQLRSMREFKKKKVYEYPDDKFIEMFDDESKRFFYYNATTGISQWTKPEKYDVCLDSDQKAEEEKIAAEAAKLLEEAAIRSSRFSKQSKKVSRNT
jgi:hypothetical protein